MISQMTPAGVSPARRARSTAASVCPARRSTPPGRAMSGNRWPGETKSAADAAGSIRVRTVRARSKAEIPVVVPLRASTLCVKAVPNGSESDAGVERLISAARSAVSGAQMSPRAWVAMKVIASGVTLAAASTRSPSFSRFSSSVMMTILPALMSATRSSIGSNAISLIFRSSVKSLFRGKPGGYRLRARSDSHSLRPFRPAGSAPFRRRRAGSACRS